jgi:hypothetical protein
LAESLSKFVDGGVRICHVIHVRASRPQSVPQLLPSDHFSLLLQEYDQDLIGLALQAQRSAIKKNLPALLIDVIRTQARVTCCDR